MSTETYGWSVRARKRYHQVREGSRHGLTKCGTWTDKEVQHRSLIPQALTPCPRCWPNLYPKTPQPST